MTLAVFALFDGSGPGRVEDLWLRQALDAVATAPGVTAVLLFTNQQSLTSRLPAPVSVTITEAGGVLWGRWQRHRRWRRQLQAAGVETVLFWGLYSFFATKLPATLLVTAADFSSRRLFRYRKQLASFRKVLVANAAAGEKLKAMALQPAPEVGLVYGRPPSRSLVETDNQLVKDRFTGGAEYFLFYGSLKDTTAVVRLLKAFSRFKRRQQSGWQLVLAGAEVPQALRDLLTTYKYRQDVVLLDNPGDEVVQSLYAAAYCFVDPTTPDYFGSALVQALSWQLPLIATEGSREWAGAAGLYFAADDEVHLAEHLMLIYKDEGLRGKLAAAATQRLERFSWQPLVAALVQKGPLN